MLHICYKTAKLDHIKAFFLRNMVNKKLQNIIAQIQKFRDERDWMQFHNPKDLALALSIEASELLELFLWKDRKEVEKFVKNKKNIEEISDELADVFTFALELAENLGIDIEKSVEQKLIKNVKKYPVNKSKGKADKYTKL